MSSVENHFAKFLAFLQLTYPSLYETLASASRKSDLVEAKLLSSNSSGFYQVIVFSDGKFENGDQYAVNLNAIGETSYSWDWRWAFAVKLLYGNTPIFKIKFKQKVIALPAGKNPLTSVFFNSLLHEFTEEVQLLAQNMNISSDNMREIYMKNLITRYKL